MIHFLIQQSTALHKSGTEKASEAGRRCIFPQTHSYTKQANLFLQLRIKYHVGIPFPPLATKFSVLTETYCHLSPSSHVTPWSHSFCKLCAKTTNWYFILRKKKLRGQVRFSCLMQTPVRNCTVSVCVVLHKFSQKRKSKLQNEVLMLFFLHFY